MLRSRPRRGVAGVQGVNDDKAGYKRAGDPGDDGAYGYPARLFPDFRTVLVFRAYPI